MQPIGPTTHGERHPDPLFPSGTVAWDDPAHFSPIGHSIRASNRCSRHHPSDRTIERAAKTPLELEPGRKRRHPANGRVIFGPIPASPAARLGWPLSARRHGPSLASRRPLTASDTANRALPTDRDRLKTGKDRPEHPHSRTAPRERQPHLANTAPDLRANLQHSARIGANSDSGGNVITFADRTGMRTWRYNALHGRRRVRHMCEAGVLSLPRPSGGWRNCRPMTSSNCPSSTSMSGSNE